MNTDYLERGEELGVVNKLRSLIRKLDYNKMTSEERLKEVNSLLSEIDNELVEYLSSNQYRNWHVKNQNQFVCEGDFNTKPFDIIANYLIYPDRDKYNILSKFAFNNKGWTKDNKGKRKKIRRVLSLREVQLLFRENEDGWNTGESEYNFKNNVRVLYSDNKSYIEKIMNNDLLSDSSIAIKVEFDNPNHIKILLKLYCELKDLLIEEENYESDIWFVLDTLDDLIDRTEFEDSILEIIELVKMGKQIIEVLDIVNNKYSRSYTYRQIEYMIGVVIPKKICDSYKNIKNDFTKSKRFVSHE